MSHPERHLYCLCWKVQEYEELPPEWEDVSLFHPYSPDSVLKPLAIFPKRCSSCSKTLFGKNGGAPQTATRVLTQVAVAVKLENLQENLKAVTRVTLLSNKSVTNRFSLTNTTTPLFILKSQLVSYRQENLLHWHSQVRLNLHPVSDWKRECLWGCHPCSEARQTLLQTVPKHPINTNQSMLQTESEERKTIWKKPQPLNKLTMLNNKVPACT